MSPHRHLIWVANLHSNEIITGERDGEEDNAEQNHKKARVEEEKKGEDAHEENNK